MASSQQVESLWTSGYELLGPTATQEPPKEVPLRNQPNVAIRRSFCLPKTELSVHLLSIVVSGIILMLSIRKVYVADLTTTDLSVLLNAFQFAARFHEFLLVVSVGYIVSYHLRYELVHANGLPFGLLASGYQLYAPRFLISRSFWVACLGQDHKRRTSAIAGLLGLAAAFTLLSGPLSAILVVPQAGWWQVRDPFSGTGGQTFLTGSHADLFPPNVNASAATGTCDTLSCWMLHLTDWTADWVNNGAAPNLTVRTKIGSTRYLSSSTPNLRTVGYAVSSTAMAHLTVSLGHLWVFAQDQNMTMGKSGRPSITMSLEGDKELMKPLIQFQCSDPYDITNATSIDIVFPTNKLARNPDQGDYPADLTRKIDTKSWKERVDVQLNWTTLPSTNNQPLLGVLIGMTFVFPERAPFFRGSTSRVVRGLMACTMDSRWAPTSMSFDPRADNIVILSDSDPATIVTNEEKMKKTQKLHIDVSYLNKIDAQLNDTDRPFTVIEYILRWFYFTDGVFDAFWSTRWPWMVATALSLHVADVIAHIEPDRNAAVVWYQNPSGALNGSIAKNLGNMNLGGGRYDYEGSDSISFPEFARSKPDRFTKVSWNIQQFGYAWSFRTATGFIAAGVVVLHMIMVIVHIIIATRRRWECDSWSSLNELVVLLLQSPRATILEGTSAGITDAKTYSVRVGIREDAEGLSAIVKTGSLSRVEDPTDGMLQNRTLVVNKRYR